jgi:hypothetical protein
MSKHFLKLAAWVFSGWTAVSVSGCAGQAAVVPPDTTHEEKPGPQSKAKEKPKTAAQDAKVIPKRKDSESGQFRFPDDKAGRRLAELLPPQRQPLAVPPDYATRPERPTGPNAGGLPDLPLPPCLIELSPLHSRPSTPARPEMPTAARVRLPSPDLHRPAPLPVLAHPVPDRPMLTDPTAAASRAAALAGKVPPQTAPAPFLRLDLPDPFEHHNAIRLRKPPKENEVPLRQGSSPPQR